MHRRLAEGTDPAVAEGPGRHGVGPSLDDPATVTATDLKLEAIQSADSGSEKSVAPIEQQLLGAVQTALISKGIGEPSHVRRSAQGGNSVPVRDILSWPARLVLPAGEHVLGGCESEADGGVAAQRAEVDTGGSSPGTVPVEDRRERSVVPEHVALPEVPVDEPVS